MRDYTAIAHKRNNENFLVARLLPRRMRVPILEYYHFCRAVDDITDDPKTSNDSKRTVILAINEAITGAVPAPYPWVEAVRQRVSAGMCAQEHPRQLLQAMLMDCEKDRYETWEALLGYCDRSAASVGRAVLDLCDEPAASRSSVSALCYSLQILNHIQDIRSDYLTLGRIYLPSEWLRQEDVEETALGEQNLSPALRRVVNHLLDGLEPLNRSAEALPASIQNRRLRVEARAILEICRRLTYKLREEDMLHTRVALSRSEVLQCVARGILDAW